MEDFERLCAECRKRGVKVILDMVFNHSAKGHPWFTAFLDDPDGPFGAYYVRKDESRRYGAGGSGRFYSARGSGGETSYFSAFGEGMPDLNCSNPAVVAEFEGILDFWISRGADGFRFDAAKHVFDPNEMPAGSPTRPMTISFWNGLREYARGKKPDVFFLGEVMSDYLTEIVAYSGCMDSVFDFPTAKQTLAAVSSPSSGASFVSSFEKAYAAYSAVPGFAPAIFLSNHDQDRSMGFFLSRSGLLGATGWGPVPGDADFARAAKSAALARAKLAASLIFTLPGLPFIYYGEELGMIGRRYLNDDVARRDAFPWNDSRSMPPNAAWTSASGKLEAGQNANTPSALSQESDPGSLLSHYRVLSSLRRRLPALSSGTWEKPPWPGFSGSGLVSYVRSGGGQRVLVVHNLAAEARKIPSDGSDALTPLFDSAGGAANSGGGRVDGDPGEIRPMSTRIFSY